MSDKPLAGIRVCDFGQHGAGSACGKVLADWGADVIKIEAARGCGSRNAGKSLNLDVSAGENIHHDMINGGKRNISINVKTEEGMEILHRIIAKSDIFFSNYRKQSLKKLGLDYETLSQKYPRLICGYLNAYGPDGEMAESPGFDSAAYWAASGITLDCGSAENGPIYTPFGGGDMVTGFTLASGLAACLYKQATTGKGQSVYTSLYGSGIWQASCMIQAAAAGTMTYPRSIKNIGSPISNTFMSKDGRRFVTGTMDISRQGPKMASMIGRPDLAEILADKEKTNEHAEEIHKLFKDFYLQHTYEEIDALLNDVDMVHNPLLHAKEVYQNKQARDNHYVSEYRTRNGKTMPMVHTPVQFGDRSFDMAPFAPLIGENTVEILKEFSYSDEEINAFLNQNIVIQTDYHEGR